MGLLNKTDPIFFYQKSVLAPSSVLVDIFYHKLRRARNVIYSCVSD